MPHFRYTAGNRPVPPHLDGMCPHHEKAFAAQYVANHLQQFNLPGKTLLLYSTPSTHNHHNHYNVPPPTSILAGTGQVTMSLNAPPVCLSVCKNQTKCKRISAPPPPVVTVGFQQAQSICLHNVRPCNNKLTNVITHRRPKYKHCHNIQVQW